MMKTTDRKATADGWTQFSEVEILASALEAFDSGVYLNPEGHLVLEWGDHRDPIDIAYMDQISCLGDLQDTVLRILNRKHKYPRMTPERLRSFIAIVIALKGFSPDLNSLGKVTH